MDSSLEARASFDGSVEDRRDRSTDLAAARRSPPQSFPPAPASPTHSHTHRALRRKSRESENDQFPAGPRFRSTAAANRSTAGPVEIPSREFLGGPAR